MRRGFTLIELITVIIIIAVLAAIAFPQYARVIERSQGSQAKAGLDMIRKAEAIYYTMNSSYGSITNIATETPEVSKLGNADWSYGVSSSASAFTGSAVRQKGIYATAAIVIDKDGVVSVNQGSASSSPASLWQ